MLKNFKNMSLLLSFCSILGIFSCGSPGMAQSGSSQDDEYSMNKKRVKRATDVNIMSHSPEQEKAQQKSQQKDQERLIAIANLPDTELGKFLKSNTLSSEYSFWHHLGNCLKEIRGFEPIEKELKNSHGIMTYEVKKLEDGKPFPNAGNEVSLEVSMALAQDEEVYSYHYNHFTGYFYKVNGTVFSIKKPGQNDRTIIGNLVVSIDGRDDFTIEFGKGERDGIVIDQSGIAKTGKISISHTYGHYHERKGKYIDGIYHPHEKYVKNEKSPLSLEIDKEYDISELKMGDEGNKMLSLLRLFDINESEEVSYLW